MFGSLFFCLVLLCAVLHVCLCVCVFECAVFQFHLVVLRKKHKNRLVCVSILFYLYFIMAFCLLFTDLIHFCVRRKSSAIHCTCIMRQARREEKKSHTHTSKIKRNKIVCERVEESEKEAHNIKCSYTSTKSSITLRSFVQ